MSVPYRDPWVPPRRAQQQADRGATFYALVSGASGGFAAFAVFAGELALWQWIAIVLAAFAILFALTFLGHAVSAVLHQRNP